MTNPIIFTDAASDYLQKMLTKENGIGIRLSLKKTGCSGYSYYPAVVKQVNSDDVQFEIRNGIKIFVDRNWVHVLQGLLVDYRVDDKSGIKQKKLVFANTNESGRCGCGESFHIEPGSKNV